LRIPDEVNRPAQGLRSPTEAEKAVIDALLSAEFLGKDALRMQMATALVNTLDEDGGLETLPAEESLPATVVNRVPVEAEAEDVDGVPIHVLLHVVDGRARELELFREDGKTVQRQPSPQDLPLLVL
jgi:uncharacterized protein DUF6984